MARKSGPVPRATGSEDGCINIEEFVALMQRFKRCNEKEEEDLMNAFKSVLLLLLLFCVLGGCIWTCPESLVWLSVKFF